jgi:hypothetical protein
MSKNGSLTDIIGVRILQKDPNTKDQYLMIHEFEGEGWKEQARLVVPMYYGRSNIAFHTLHCWKSGITPPVPVTTGPFWLLNPYFHAAFLAE